VGGARASGAVGIEANVESAGAAGQHQAGRGGWGAGTRVVEKLVALLACVYVYVLCTQRPGGWVKACGEQVRAYGERSWWRC